MRGNDAPVLITDEADVEIRRLISDSEADSVVVLTDTNVEAKCLPDFKSLSGYPKIVIASGEASKTLCSAQYIWRELERLGAGRSSLLVNVGGGMITDIGGFAASLFKRGIRFVNVATSLLGAVDASVGGKTGVDFNGLKNEIGVFSWPEATVIATRAFGTLPTSELYSGYGEILKTAYIAAPELLPILSDAEAFLDNPESISRAVKRCVEIKREVVDSDPFDNGRRAILNFGHTAGHAFEALSMEKCGKDGIGSLPHGIAVAYGMLTALILSNSKLGLDSAEINRMAGISRNFRQRLCITCDDYPRLLELIHSDKKNVGGKPARFVLLRKAGDAVARIEVNDEDIRTALDITRDYLGI